MISVKNAKKRYATYVILTAALIGIIAIAFTSCGGGSSDKDMEGSQIESEETADKSGVNESDAYYFIYKEKVRGDYGALAEPCGPLLLVQDNKRDDESDKLGAFNDKGELVIPCKYTWIRYIGNQRWIVENDEGNGVVDEKGNEILPCSYSQLDITYTGSDKESELDDNTSGEGESDNIPLLSAKEKEDGPVILISAIDGKTIQETDLKEVGLFGENGLAAAKFKNDKWGYVDRKGNTVIEPKYDLAREFGEEDPNISPDKEEDAAVVEMNRKQGVIDKSGNWLIPCKYDYIVMYSNGLAEVNNIKYENGDESGDPIQLYGVVDSKGNEIIPITESGHDETSIYLAGDMIEVTYTDFGSESTEKKEYYDRNGKEVDKEEAIEYIEKKRNESNVQQSGEADGKNLLQKLKQGKNELWAITDEDGKPVTDYIFNTEEGHE